jgi:hypothetical protein
VTARQQVESACDKARRILSKYEMDKGAPAIPPPKPDLERLIERLSRI